LFRSSDASYPALRTQTTNLRGAEPFRTLAEIPFRFKLFPTNPVCFIPVQLSHKDPAIWQPDPPYALIFRQRPLPYKRRNRARSRIADPTAMVSISEISPTSSKSIRERFYGVLSVRLTPRSPGGDA
jgi:hypothetical protein